MKMITRKFHLILILLTGLLVFQGTIVEAQPREKARVELVEKIQEKERKEKETETEEQEKKVNAFISPFKFFVAEKPLQKPLVLHPHLHTRLISTIHHHSSL